MTDILYGGDYPYTPAPFVKSNREKFENYEPIRPYIEVIFRNNAIKLFNLALPGTRRIGSSDRVETDG